MTSSPACWAAFGEVMAREYADPALMAVHRLSVDAYAVQHPGGRDDQSVRSVSFHLARLCLTVAHGLAPAPVDAAMRQVAQARTDWLRPPAERGAITVGHVRGAPTPEHHAEAAGLWARSAWAAWAVHHPTVLRLIPPGVLAA